MIAQESLGDQGRDVRCAKCGHVWHHKSEKDALDELINKIQSEEMDEILFGDAAAEKRKAEKENAALTRKSKLQTIRKKASGLLVSKKLAGGLVGLAAFLSLTFAVIQARAQISHLLPRTERVFDRAGFYVHKEPVASPEKTLTVDRLTIQRNEGQPPIITGMLINLTQRTVVVPPIKLTFISETGAKLDSFYAELDTKTLPQEGTYALNIPLDKPQPLGAVSVDLTFGK